MVYILDEIHAEQRGPFGTFEDAVAELQRRASLAWDAPPNQAPCSSWRTCGRRYYVIEYDARSEPWKLLRDVHVLDISATGVTWVEGFQRGWRPVLNEPAPAVQDGYNPHRASLRQYVGRLVRSQS